MYVGTRRDELSAQAGLVDSQLQYRLRPGQAPGDAPAITTHTLMTPQLPGTTAVRSSGCFSTAGLWIWAQYSTYIAGSTRADQGQLIQHSVFTESGCRARLTDNVI